MNKDLFLQPHAADLSLPAPAEEPARQYYFMEKARVLVGELSGKAGRRLLANVRTFGCQMNEKDSEKLRGILEYAGYTLSDSEEADLVIYNTCTVRENANNKVYGRLGVLNGYKKKNPFMKIGLCGCMTQEPSAAERIRTGYRFVDLVFGTHNLYRFAELLCRMLESDAPVTEIWDKPDQIVEDLPADRTYPFKSGVNIMFGCNNFCTYCIVPYVRGRERSRSPQSILKEVQALAEDGVTEIMLLGQNVNSYDGDHTFGVSFPQLLEMCAQVPGIRRIRFMTSHPKDLSDELIEVMARNDVICKHLHLPLQSGSSRLLALMNRHYTKEDYLALVDRLKAAMPDLTLSTDLIVGFPGETEEDLLETLDVVEKAAFDSAFTFQYSPRSGTPAASWQDDTPQEVVQERFDRLLALVQKTGAMRAERFTGSVQEVLVESVNRQDPHLVTGRMDNNSVVHLPGSADLIGTYVRVRLAECHGFYYIGERME